MPSIEKKKRANSRTKVRNLTTEHDEQVTVIEWAAHQTNKYPELDLLYAIPNWRGIGKPFITKSGLKLPPLEMVRWKQEGVKKGVPDLCLPVARGHYHALYIEMKRNDGVLTEDQKKWHEKLVAYENLVLVCYSADEAIEKIKDYLNS